MHIDPCFEDTSETTILKNVGGSSKLTRKGEKALKNKPIAVEENSFLANFEILLYCTLNRNRSSSIHILAILKMIRMQRAIPYRSLTQTLSYKDALRLKILDLDDKTEKGVDFCSRYKCLKHFSFVELWALLFLICCLLDLINQNIGCRRQDECKLKLNVEKLKNDWFYERKEVSHVPNIFCFNSIKILQGFQDIGFKNLESVRQGKIRNGNGLPPSRISYKGHSKTYRSEQKDFVLFRMNERINERMQTIPEETTKVEKKETAFSNEEHFQEIDYSQKRKNAPAKIVGEPGNASSRNINNLTISFMANTEYFDQKLIPVQSSFTYQILNLALLSKSESCLLDFIEIFGDRLSDCTPWVNICSKLWELKNILLSYWITKLIKLVGWRGHDRLISQVECELKRITKTLKGACSYELDVEEKILRIGIKRLYGTQDILESVRQGKMRKSGELAPSRISYTGQSKTFRSEQKESVCLENTLEKMQKIPEETGKFEAKETAFGNETNLLETLIILKNEKTRLPKSLAVLSQINQETLPQEI